MHSTKSNSRSGCELFLLGQPSSSVLSLQLSLQLYSWRGTLYHSLNQPRFQPRYNVPHQPQYIVPPLISASVECTASAEINCSEAEISRGTMYRGICGTLYCGWFQPRTLGTMYRIGHGKLYRGWNQTRYIVPWLISAAITDAAYDWKRKLKKY